MTVTNSNIQPPHKASVFITFEGGEGAGKTTQIKLLAKAFEDAGRKVTVTREPGGTEGAESIRDLLVRGDVAKWCAKTELLLHLAARHDHVNRLVYQKLKDCENVICDRFTDSTIAYQAYGHGLGLQFVEQLCGMVLGNFVPDLTIILDIDVKQGINRASIRSSKEDRYEQMDTGFHEHVRKGFLEIAALNPQRCVVINAEDDINAIHANVLAAIKERLGIGL